MPPVLRLVHDRDAAPARAAAPAPRTPSLEDTLTPETLYWLARKRLAAAEKRLAEEPTPENEAAAQERRVDFSRASRALIRAVRD